MDGAQLMAKRKDTSPLFEIIHNAGRPSEPNVRIPDWLRKQQEAQGRKGGQGGQAEQNESSAGPEPEREPEPPQSQAGAGAAGDSKPGGEVHPEAGEEAPRAGPGSSPEPVEPPAGAGESVSASGWTGGGEAEPDDEAHPAEARQHAVSSVDASDGPADHPISGDGWLAQPIDLRVTHGRALAVSGIALVVLISTFMLGRMVGRETAQANQQSYQSQREALYDAAGPVEDGLIPDSVNGVETQTAGAGAGSGGGSAVLGSENDPREAGLNYFRLETVPSNGREEGRAAVRFLRQNGVDAALIPIKNGNSLKLVALRGFESPYSDQAAQQFKRKLESLGRAWKTQHDGSSDWMDMYPEKYRPGVN